MEITENDKDIVELKLVKKWYKEHNISDEDKKAEKDIDKKIKEKGGKV